MINEMHIFPNGDVERGTGEPGYEWVPAYSEVTLDGYYNPITLKETRDLAARDKRKVTVHRTEAAARAALAALLKI